MWRLCSVALQSFVAVLMWRFSLGEHCKSGDFGWRTGDGGRAVQSTRCLCLASPCLPHFICHSVMTTSEQYLLFPLYLSLFLILKTSAANQPRWSASGIQCYLLCLLYTGNITEPSLTSSSSCSRKRQSTAVTVHPVFSPFPICFACF